MRKGVIVVVEDHVVTSVPICQHPWLWLDGSDGSSRGSGYALRPQYRRRAGMSVPSAGTNGARGIVDLGMYFKASGFQSKDLNLGCLATYSVFYGSTVTIPRLCAGSTCMSLM